MSDKKISELPLASAINPNDISVLVSNGTDYQFAFTTLLQLIGSNLAVGANISFGTTLPQNNTGKNGDVFINTNTGSFAQKRSGTWSVVYTLPTSGSITDGTVLYGLGVPGGSTGNNNDTYINIGTGVFYKKSGGSWNQVFSMQSGPQGPSGIAGTNGADGINGYSILSGSSNPSNLSTGTNGDFYINTTSYTIFGPKTSGNWGDGIPLIGAGIDAGGTTDQILAKNSDTDYDTKWVSIENVLGYTPENIANKGIVNGYAPLNASTKIDATFLPSYVSDIVTTANFVALPSPGTAGFIYITADNNKEYRWNTGTSAYIELVPSPGTTDALAEGIANLYYHDSLVSSYGDAHYLKTLLSGDVAINSAGYSLRVVNSTGSGVGSYLDIGGFNGRTSTLGSYQIDTTAALTIETDQIGGGGISMLLKYTGGVIELNFTTSGLDNYFRDDTQNGLSYYADYSVNFTDRSLVDKGYVDTVIAAGGGTSYDFTNGLTETDGTVVLGGTISTVALYLTDINSSFNVGGFVASGAILLDSSGALIGYEPHTGEHTFLRLTASGITFEDSINNKGVEYVDDYSTNYTARSLVDKAYVDSVVADSGINIYNTDGTITGNRTVTTTGYGLTFYNPNNQIFIRDSSAGLIHHYSSAGILVASEIQVFDGSISMHVDDAISGNSIAFGFGSSIGFNITDQIFNRGMVYAADYSANFTDRSLVDKSYVDAAIAAGGGGTYTFANGLTDDGSGNIILGGTFIANTTVELADKSLLIGDISSSPQVTAILTLNPNSDIYTSAHAQLASTENASLLHFVLDEDGTQIGSAQMRAGTGSSVLYVGYDDNIGYAQFTYNIGSGWSISDSLNNSGINYISDYSANYTDRSLVDKAYVDSVAGGSSVNIYNTDGAITEDRQVTTTGHSLTFGSASSSILIADNQVTLNHYHVAPGILRSSEFQLSDDGAAISMNDANTGNSLVLGFNNSTGIEITDQIFSKGAFYHADYSSNYTDRSLVDKAYVDGAISAGGGAYIFANGLKNDGSDSITLGGLLNSATELTIDGTFTFTLDNTVDNSIFQLSSGSALLAGGDRFGRFSSIQLTDNNTNGLIISYTVSPSAGVKLIQFNTDDDGILVEDTATNKGFVYSADYSANYTARSLVDKSYVDTAITAGGGGIALTDLSAVEPLQYDNETGVFSIDLTKRIGTTASSSTPTPDAGAHDQFNITALAVSATIAAPIGTPTDGQSLIIRIKDNGTSRSLARNAIYRIGADLTPPTSTTPGKTSYEHYVYNAADTKWDFIGLTGGF